MSDPVGIPDIGQDADVDFWKQMSSASVVPSKLGDPYGSPVVFGEKPVVRERRVNSLEELLREVWNARQQNPVPDIDSVDNPMARYIGYVIGNEWVYIPLTKMKETLPVPEDVAALFGLTSEDVKNKMVEPDGRKWFTGRLPDDLFDCDILIEDEDPVRLNAEIGELSRLWASEDQDIKPEPYRIEMPEGMNGPIVFVPDEHPELAPAAEVRKQS